MTAPLPPLPAPADQLNDFFAPDQMIDFAKLAVREALERATDAMHHAGVNTWEDAVLILRALIEEYK